MRSRVSGIFAEYLPLPPVWSYVVLLALSVASIMALLASPDDRPAVRAGWRPQTPFVPAGIRIGFAIATLSVALAYSVGAIFLSLGAHMIGQFTSTDNTAVVGALPAMSAFFIGGTGLFLAKVPARTLVWSGTALTLLSPALMAAASTVRSLPLFPAPVRRRRHRLLAGLHRRSGPDQPARPATSPWRDPLAALPDRVHPPGRDGARRRCARDLRDARAGRRRGCRRAGCPVPGHGGPPPRPPRPGAEHAGGDPAGAADRRVSRTQSSILPIGVFFSARKASSVRPRAQ
uniref:Uncharacterized protein n=1 Tax=Janibacter limosus TaxID=53458 RepID=A0AC61U2X6_9MICO